MKPNIIKQLASELDRIESLPVDDEGNRIVPPGTLDKARKLIQKSFTLAPALDKLIEAAQCVHVDCLMALTDTWDRSDDGFDAMRESLAKALTSMGSKPRSLKDNMSEAEDTQCPECERSFGPHYRGPCEH